MISKERVKRAIHFSGPDRIPYHLPEPYPSDITWIFPKGQNIKIEMRDGVLYRLSEWGSWWQVVSEENMGEVVEPAIREWEEYEKYSLPQINELERYAHVKDLICENSDRYIMGVLSTSLFPHYWEVRGITNFFMDLYLNIDMMEDLLDKLVVLQMQSIEIWATYPIDGIVVGFDDWGLQDRLMIRPELWRKYFKPRYQKVWENIRSRGMDVILHSCGDITSILGDMIEIGLNVINMDQQENMGIERLTKEFGGRICFWNPTDIQTVMQKGTLEEVEQYNLSMMKRLGGFNGGFIGKFYPQPNAAGHSPERTKASLAAFVRYADQIYGG